MSTATVWLLRRWAPSALALGLLLPVNAGALSLEPFWTALQPDGYVTDVAGVFADADESALEADLARYAQETTNEIAVVVVQNLSGGAIEDAARELGRRWEVGQGDRNNGVVFLVALDERAVRLEVGYGLEGAVPDLAAKHIIENAIVPLFRTGDYAGGIRAGVAALKEEIGGEYRGRARGERVGFDLLLQLLLLAFFPVSALAHLLARTKSWWLGGLVGGALGLLVAVLARWWPAAPLLTLVGLGIDWILSKILWGKVFAPRGAGRHGLFLGPWSRGGSGRGGFGGFGGGSFGGGGASGKW